MYISHLPNFRVRTIRHEERPRWIGITETLSSFELRWRWLTLITGITRLQGNPWKSRLSGQLRENYAWLADKSLRNSNSRKMISTDLNRENRRRAEFKTPGKMTRRKKRICSRRYRENTARKGKYCGGFTYPRIKTCPRTVFGITGYADISHSPCSLWTLIIEFLNTYLHLRSLAEASSRLTDVQFHFRFIQKLLQNTERCVFFDSAYTINVVERHQTARITIQIENKDCDGDRLSCSKYPSIFEGVP